MLNLETARGTVNTDQSRTRPARNDWRGSSEIVGYQSADTSKLGAAPELSQRICSPGIPSNSRRRALGGQASGPGLFGVPSVTGRPRRFGQVAAFQAPPSLLTPAMRQAAAVADERERFVVPSLEEWERPASWGHTEAAIALD